MPSYFPVMQYAEDRALRETLYRASATRASEFGKPEWDNTPLIARILALRKEDAALLGYASFAEVSLVPKMAQTPTQVLDFLRDLAGRARPFAERDLAELRAVRPRRSWASRSSSPGTSRYASEKLRAKRYAFSDQEVKQYFPGDAGAARACSSWCETLYGRYASPSRSAGDLASGRALLRHPQRRRRS